MKPRDLEPLDQADRHAHEMVLPFLMRATPPNVLNLNDDQEEQSRIDISSSDSPSMISESENVEDRREVTTTP